MAGRETASPAGAQAPSDVVQVLRAVRPPLVAILMLLMFGTFYMARELLLPIVLAFVLAITLSPVVRALSRRAIPAPVTALAIVATLIASLASGAYLLSEPVAKWIEMAPSIGAELKAKLYHLREPVAAVVQAREQVEDIASAVSTQISDTRQIAVEGPGLLSLAANGAISTVTTFSLSLVLLLFLLMSGDMFYEKLVRVAPTFADKRKTLTIVYDVERRVSRYLFSITLINVALGVCVGALLHLAGMPNPVLWGVLATALNYIPYIGPAVGIVLVAIVAAVTFDTLTAMAVPPGAVPARQHGRIATGNAARGRPEPGAERGRRVHRAGFLDLDLGRAGNTAGDPHPRHHQGLLRQPARHVRLRRVSFRPIPASPRGQPGRQPGRRMSLAGAAPATS